MTLKYSVALGFAFACTVLGTIANAAGPVTVWNSNLSANVTYDPLTPASKPDDWVYVDARLLHPTQFCLGYREVAYRAKTISGFSSDQDSHARKSSVYPYLAKKDIPIVIAPDGTAYLTDGHHTLAALIASSQADKTAFGHIVANFHGKSQANFVAYMTDSKNNDCYLYGPSGNGLLNAPSAIPFENLPNTIYSSDAATRMANDPYRSLGWAMKENAYLSKPDSKHGEDALWENFIEFRWGDLFRDKIIWNNDSDDSFYIASANADTLAHSEATTDLTGGFSPRDLPGYIPTKTGQVFGLNITNDTRIEGDIAAPAGALTTLDINAAADSTILVAGSISELSQLRINAGGKASPSLEKGKFNPVVAIAPGTGTIVLTGKSPYVGLTTVAAGRLIVNGSIDNSAVDVQAGAVLRGSGSVGVVSGKGSVVPGCSIGILTANAIDPSKGLNLAFEFTSSEPLYGSPLHSKNDVLVLTAANSFLGPMTAANSIDIYLRVASIKPGDTFIGGVFAKADASLTTAIAGAKVHYFIADAHGSTLFSTARFIAIDPRQFCLTMNVIPVTAHFSGVQHTGLVTQIAVAAAK